MHFTRRLIAAATLAASLCLGQLAAPAAAQAQDKASLDARGSSTLQQLESIDPRARYLAHHSYAVLIFPSVLKAGFVFGGETGNGVLFIHHRPAGYYNMTGGSWGLQIGGQDFSYALFFRNRGALEYLNKSQGFQAGTGPSIVVLNTGAGAEADTTTLTQDVVAMPFNQKGLMADLTLQGTKITRIGN